MLVKEFLFSSTCSVRNGNFLKMRVSEIRLKRIRVNQELGVVQKMVNIQNLMKVSFVHC